MDAYLSNVLIAPTMTLINISVFMVICLNFIYALELLTLSRNRLWSIISHAGRDQLAIAGIRNGTSITIIGGSIFYIFLLNAPSLTMIASTAVCIVSIRQFGMQRYGQEGSDHVRLYANIFIFITSVIHFLGIAKWDSFYLSATAALGAAFYFGSGLAKCTNIEWWTGAALKKALSTQIFGNRWLWQFLINHQRLACITSSTICIWELSFPLAIHFSKNFFVIWLVIGLAFHIAVAIFMRLPLFVWAALSLYPGIWWAHNTFKY